ncbi:MAG: trypsin-like peptidase domain-containing protein [Firmicutes bacterium]|nr:trypsin-like peptidase domain-containing protein [Bacillota bacterium]
MDEWNKTPLEEDKFEEYRVDDHTAQVFVTNEKHKKQPYVTKGVFAITLIIAMLFSSIVGAGAFAVASGYFGENALSKHLNTTNYNIVTSTGSELSVQEIVAKNENSVVAITTESMATDIWARQYVTSGAGSGVVYSEDGYILTNNHVIEGAGTIKVTLHNGKTYDATLVAADSRSDIAVLKVDGVTLTPVAFNEELLLSVGDLAVAIGNPLGTLAGTATEGIISGLERDITLEGKEMTLLQISASINPGNSGGGVFDQYGNLIGLVVAKSSGSDVEGLGFAIPADTVKTVADSLIKSGYVSGRPAAGITIVDLTSAEEAMKYGVSLTGVYIKEVTSSTAKEAGLRPGDLIYMINKEQVTSSQMLVNTIQSHKVGDTVVFTIVRDDKMHEIKVKLQEATQ